MNINHDYRGRRYLDAFNFDYLYDSEDKLIGAGQINITEIYPGTVCAFHRHKIQADYWMVASGELEVITVDGDNINNMILKDGLTYVGQTVLNGPLMITPGVWHGYRCLGNKPAVLVYYVTRKYNSEVPDEERITPEKLGVEFSSKVK